jgi:hypothetical protein
MSEAKMNISKLSISLHGVSAIVAEEAVSNLGNELRRRLNEYDLQDFILRDLNNISISPIHVRNVLDANGLSGIIADRLIESITHTDEKNEEEKTSDASSESAEGGE